MAARARAGKALEPAEFRAAEVRLLADADHYDTLIARELPDARVSLWIATANVKDLHVEAPLGSRARARGRYVSILETLDGLAARGVELRLLHGREPSPIFAARLSRMPRLKRRLKMAACPRVHLKTIVVDGRIGYLGSANFTGAGLGARSDGRRNFELGLVTHDDFLLDRIQGEFDAIWSGRRCGACRMRSKCPKPLDAPIRAAAKSGKARPGRGTL
jgi:phosphatidylserine/phosphatidylglycerophosphate/cardiolipin synthase-like enzyme